MNARTRAGNAREKSAMRQECARSAGNARRKTGVRTASLCARTAGLVKWMSATSRRSARTARNARERSQP